VLMMPRPYRPSSSSLFIISLINLMLHFPDLFPE
jgi:hypothetical protein